MILSPKKSVSNFTVFHNFKYPFVFFFRKNIICYLNGIKKKKKKKHTHKPAAGVAKLVLF